MIVKLFSYGKSDYWLCQESGKSRAVVHSGANSSFGVAAATVRGTDQHGSALTIVGVNFNFSIELADALSDTKEANAKSSSVIGPERHANALVTNL
jgi:hypothetical protein